MEQILACWAALGRQLFVSTDNRVANGTFCLAFERSGNVLAPGSESIDDAAVLDSYQLSVCVD